MASYREKIIGGGTHIAVDGRQVRIKNLTILATIPDIHSKGGRKRIQIPWEVFVEAVAIGISGHLPEMGDEIADALANRIRGEE